MVLTQRIPQVGEHPFPPQVLADDADVSLVIAAGDDGPELFGFDEGPGLALPVGEIGRDGNEALHGVPVDRHKTAQVGQVDGVRGFLFVVHEVSDHVRVLLECRCMSSGA